MTKSKRPEPGTPEFKEWLAEKSRQDFARLFRDPPPQELIDAERGIIAGPRRMEDLLPEKTIAEDIAIDRDQAQAKRHLKRVK